MAEGAVLSVLINAKDEASKVLTGLQASMDGLKKAGMGLTVVGGAITGALAMTVKAAAAEEAGIIKLQQALKNVSINYDAVKESLEANIALTQYKTSIADDAQRKALQSLIEVTGDYEKSLSLLPLALDMAIAKDMDFAMAAEVVGRVAAGNITILSRYGIQLEKGATATEALGALTEKFGGQAEAFGDTMSGQMQLLKNNVGDVTESIGALLLPALTSVFEKINLVVLGIQNWISNHPALAAIITWLAGAAGIGALITGFTLLSTVMITKAIPSVIAAIVALKGLIVSLWSTVAAQLAVLTAMGPAGWVILGVAIVGIAGAITFAAIKSKEALEELAEQTRAVTDETNAMNQTMAEIPKFGETAVRRVTITPSFQYGGIVPGAIGRPVPIIAHGGERFLGAGTAGGDVFNFTIQGNVTAERDLISAIREEIIKIKQRNYTSGF